MPEKLLESVTVPPNATVPPAHSPDPASTLMMEESANMLLVTPAAGMLIVPVLMIGRRVGPGNYTPSRSRNPTWSG